MSIFLILISAIGDLCDVHQTSEMENISDSFASSYFVENHRFNCHLCNKSYKNKAHLKRHFMDHSGVKFSCWCGKIFARKDILKKHIASKKHFKT